MYKNLFLLSALTTSFLCTASNALEVSSLTELSSQAHVLAFGALFFAILYGGALCISFIFEKYIAIPRTAGMLLSGIILGPSGLNIARFFQETYSIANRGFSLGQYDFLFQFFTSLCSLFAVSWLLWLAGHETDIKKVKSVGFIAVAAGILGALVPFSLCVLVIPFFGISTTVAQALGLMFAATSISIPVALLISLGKMDSRPARATLAAAVVDDIVAVIMVSVFFSVAGQTDGGVSGGIYYTIGTMFIGLSVMLLFGFYVLPIIYAYARSFHTEAPLYVGILALFLFYASAELVIGVAGITGAYFAGFFHARNANATLEHTVEPFVTRLLLPLFLVGVGLHLNVMQLSLYQWGIVVVLTLLAIVSKVAACSGVVAIENYRNKVAHQWTLSESLVFGFSMVARGEVGLVVASLVRTAGFIDDQWYAAAVVALILTTIATPLLVSLVFASTDKSEEVQVPLDCSLDQMHEGLKALGIECAQEDSDRLAVEFEGSRLFLKKLPQSYSITGRADLAARCAQLLEKRAL